MPRGDRTGPMGMGLRTGRGAGYCSGFGAPGFTNPMPGRGAGTGFGRNAGVCGRGFGGGRGWRNTFYATGVPGWGRFGGYGVVPAAYQTADPDVENQSLKRQAELLESELEAVKKRLAEVETAKSGD